MFKYTLEDLIVGITEQPITKIDATPTFYNVFKEYLNESSATYWNDRNGKVLFELIFNLHYRDYVIISKNEIQTVAEFKASARDFVFSFYGIYKRESGYYDTLLSYYSTQKLHLLDKLSRETHGGNQFNDTPQEYDIETFADDGHATNVNITHATESYDDTDAMTRLKKIQDSYRDLMTEYAKKFDTLFISPLNFNDCDF